MIIKKVDYDYINVGGGEDLSIKQLAELIKKTINYKGKIVFNKSYPDGVKARKINSSIIKRLGWYPKIKLKDGLIKYCDYYAKEIMPKEKLDKFSLEIEVQNKIN